MTLRSRLLPLLTLLACSADGPPKPADPGVDTGEAPDPGRDDTAPPPDTAEPAPGPGETGGDTGEAPPEPTRFVALDLGDWAACALDDLGGPWCWGNGYMGKTDVPPKLVGRELSAGIYAACVLTPGGATECWGYELFDWEVETDWSLPIPDDIDHGLTAGASIVCGLDAGGELTCGGYKEDIDLGYSDLVGPFTKVSAADVAACALRADGTLACFGDPRVRGKDYSDITVPPEGSDWVDVECGGAHCCALNRQHEPTCWGGQDSRMAYGTNQNRPPNRVRFKDLCVSDWVGCGVKLDGELACWYDHFEMAASAPLPTENMPAGPFVEVSCASDFWCALTPEGTIECWGYDDASGNLRPPEL